MNKIKADGLIPFFHGALSCRINPDGRIQTDRFTALQLERYHAESERRRNFYDRRGQASAGISLDMLTDSSFLVVNFTTSIGSHEYGSFDFYTDGVLTGHFHEDVFQRGSVYFELPEGTHRAQLFFPWSLITCVSSIVLSEGAVCRPVQKTGRLLSFGDSITEGCIVTHPSLNYVSCVSRALDLECVNQGIGGYYFDSLTLDPALADFRPDLITVAYGTNDYSILDDAVRYGEVSEAYLERLTKIFPDTKILMILPLFRGDYGFHLRSKILDYSLEDARGILRALGSRYPNVTVLEDSFYPHLPEFFAPDFLHPNDIGSLILGQAVTEAARKLMTL